MGEIIDIEEQSTSTKLTIEDGTGQIIVKRWNDTANADDGEGSAPQKPSTLKQGMWVRFLCSIKNFNDVQQITAHSCLEDVMNKDFNAITHHYLQAIVESLGKTKGPLSKPKLGGVGQTSAAATYGQPAAFVAQRSSGPAVVADTGGGDLNSALQAIFERAAPTDHGWSVEDIMGQMTFKAERSAVKAAILGMCDDGALYSTVDDEHYASTA